MKLTVFATKFAAGEIDAHAGIIHDVSVLTRGEARGHGMFVDDVMLQQVVEQMGGKPKGLKAKLDHGYAAGKLIGKFAKPRIDGNQVKADLHLINTSPFRDYVVELSQEMPESCGMSIEFKCDTEEVNGKTFARCKDLYAAALVERPAANSGGMFEEKNFAEVTPEELAEVKTEDREEAGMPDGSYPVATGAQAESAIKMRGRSKTHSKSEILNHVARRVGAMLKAEKISQAEHDALMAKCDEARKVDRGQAASGKPSETHLDAGAVDNAQKGNAEETTQLSQENDMTKEEMQIILSEALKPLSEKITALENGQAKNTATAVDINRLLAEQMAKLSITPSAASPVFKVEDKKADKPKTFMDHVAEQVKAGMKQMAAQNFCAAAHPAEFKEYREKILGVVMM